MCGVLESENSLQLKSTCEDELVSRWESVFWEMFWYPCPLYPIRTKNSIETSQFFLTNSAFTHRPTEITQRRGNYNNTFPCWRTHSLLHSMHVVFWLETGIWLLLCVMENPLFHILLCISSGTTIIWDRHSHSNYDEGPCSVIGQFTLFLMVYCVACFLSYIFIFLVSICGANTHGCCVSALHFHGWPVNQNSASRSVIIIIVWKRDNLAVAPSDWLVSKQLIDSWPSIHRRKAEKGRCSPSFAVCLPYITAAVLLFFLVKCEIMLSFHRTAGGGEIRVLRKNSINQSGRNKCGK